MAVRKQIARTITNDVQKKINGRTICLKREDSFLQNKSILYRKLKLIESGKLKLPIPIGKISCRAFYFVIQTDGGIKMKFAF